MYFHLALLDWHSIDSEFSFWPTPTASDGKRVKFSAEQLIKHREKMWKAGYGGRSIASEMAEHDLPHTPMFSEWLMGFPPNWTSLD